MKFEKQLLFLICIFAAAQAFANNEIVVIAKLKQVATPLVHGECPRSLDTNSLRYSLGMSGCIEPSGNCYKGILSLTGNETINGSLIVTGTTTLSDLTVTGPTSFTGPTTFSILTVTGNASVAGLTTLATLTVTGSVYVAGLATLSSLTVTGNETVVGNATIGTLNGHSSETLQGSLSVANNAVVDGNLQAGSYSFTSPPAAGTPGIPGVGGFLAYGQLYTTASFSVAAGATFPLDIENFLDPFGGVTVNGNGLQVALDGTYIIYYYAVCFNNAGNYNPLLLFVSANFSSPIAGGIVQGTSGAQDYLSGSAASYVGASGVVIANLSATDTVTLLNGTPASSTFNSFSTVGGNAGVVASLIVARIA